MIESAKQLHRKSFLRDETQPGKVVSKRMVDLAAEAKSRTWRQKEKRDGDRICSGAESRWGEQECRLE
jgi:hypothetical protein